MDVNSESVDTCPASSLPGAQPTVLAKPSDLKHLNMEHVSITDTFAIKGTQETFTITVSRQDDNNDISVTKSPRKDSNTSNASSRSSTFNIQFLQDDMSTSGYSDPGIISDNDFSPGTSYHDSHEDLFQEAVLARSDTDDDYIEEDMHKRTPKHHFQPNYSSIEPSSSSNQPCPSSNQLFSSSIQPRSSSNQPTSPRTKSRWGNVRHLLKWSPFIQVYKKHYQWIQLAGHQGGFRSGGGKGTILKKCSKMEASALKTLMDDCMKPYVPEFKSEAMIEGELHVEMQDLLRDFDDNPAVMDIKLGVRTYLEDEITKGKDKLRNDMYKKMIEVDPNEPTAEEHLQLAITKPRYMQWRESISSSSTMGFRIEGIKSTDNKVNTDYKTIRTMEQVTASLRKFIDHDNHIVKEKLLDCLKCVREAIEASDFFKSHEVIGSSLLFVYDSHDQAGVWVIDFGKTVPLPDGITITHRLPWRLGNHEDGYLWGLDNLISVWEKF